MCLHACYENVFALQLHVEGVQVRSDVRQQCLELAVIQVKEEDGVNDLHHNRHDVAHGTGIFWLWFRGLYCNVIAEHGGGPDARPLWAGYGPRAGGCPPLGLRLRVT